MVYVVDRNLLRGFEIFRFGRRLVRKIRKRNLIVVLCFAIPKFSRLLSNVREEYRKIESLEIPPVVKDNRRIRG